MKPLSTRDRRALLVLGCAAAICAAIFFWPSSRDDAAASVSVPQAEKRLTKLRRVSASVAPREEIAKRLAAELSTREKGLIAAETPAQAQAQLLQIVRRVAQTQTPRLDLSNADFGMIRPFGTAYGEVSVTITVEAGIEQILNFLADLGNQPELIAATNLTFGQAREKKKTVPVRLTVSGLVSGKLLPEKKREAAF
jgi:hypothetical protein